jgi:hypothetical protein
MLLKALKAAIEGDKEACLMAADYLLDLQEVSTPEEKRYAAWIRFSPTLGCFIDAVAKFGTKNERHLIRKVVKLALALNKIPRERTRQIIRRENVDSSRTKDMMLLAFERVSVV